MTVHIMTLLSVVFSMLLLTTTSKAQQLTIKGQVYNSIDSSSASYATIEVLSQKTGVASDEKGQFSITLELVQPNDSLLIRALGYKDLVLPLKDFTANNNVLNIYVTPKSYNLKEITIQSSEYTKSEIKGVTESKFNASFHANAFNKIALYIDNNNSRKGIIKSVNFFIHKNGKHRAPFRVRIYKIGPSGQPGEDLLTQTVLGKAKKKKSWVNINLEKHAISIPEDGFFVCMEWIYTSDKYYYIKTLPRDMGTYKLYGATLANTPVASGQGRTWTTYLGNAWHKVSSSNNSTFDALINAELVYED